MNFGGDAAKAWKDIWCAAVCSVLACVPLLDTLNCRGCGQGIGAVNKVQGAGELVAQMLIEYAEAKNRWRVS